MASPPVLTIDTGGHKSSIMNLCFTRDSRYLVSASKDKTVRVWDVSTGETVRVIRGHIAPGSEGKIFAADLSNDDRLLAVGGWLGSYTGNRPSTEEGAHHIRLIDFQTGEVMGTFKGHANVIDGLAFSPDGNRLVSGGSDDRAIIWDTATFSAIHQLEGHTDNVYAVAFSPDGQRVATGSDDHTVKLWDARTGSLIRTLTGHTERVRTVVFTPDGRYLLSGSRDKTVRLWRGDTGDFIKVLGTSNRHIRGLSVTPDSTRVVTGHAWRSGPRVSHVFEIPSGREIVSFDQNTNTVLTTAVSPDGRTVATGGGDEREIYLWNIDDGSVVGKLVGRGSSIYAVGFSADGRSIAWGKTWGRADMVHGRGELEQALVLKNDSGAWELSMEVSTPAAGDYRTGIDRVGVWQIRTEDGQAHETLEILKNGIVSNRITRGSTTGFYHQAFTLTPDGETIISGASPGTLTSYRTRTGETLREFVGHVGTICALATSADGRYLVSGASDQTVRLWDIASGRLLLTVFQGSDKEWVAWTPEGYYTASLKGANYIGWHMDRGEAQAASYYPAKTFADRFYSPAIVAKYLETGGDLDTAILLANQDAPLSKQVAKTEAADLNRFFPPTVFIQLPGQRDSTVSENRVRIRAVAKSVNNEPIEDMWVLVNGRRAEGTRAIAVEGTPGKSIEGLRASIDMTVTLTGPENRISVIAANRHAQSEPEIVTVRWEAGGGAATAGVSPDRYKPDLYVLSIGVSRYSNGQYSLDYAHKDAQALSEELGRQAGRLYNSVKERVLIDAQATRGNILDGLDWILQEATQKDLAVIFVAGHGLKDSRGNYYFLPYEGDLKSLRRTGVKWFDFQDVLNSLPSKVMLLVDTCHSGGVTGKRRDVGDITDTLRELVNAESGVVVMTASTGKEFSQEHPDWGHGAFTKALVEGLRGGADYDGNRTVELKELDLFVTQRVKQLTGGSQHPTTEIPRTLPNFPIAVP